MSEMIVSILQLMGFPRGKPVHSRAEETRVSPPPKAAKAEAATRAHAQASTARRQDVKATSAKDTKAKDVASKDVKVTSAVKAAAKSPVKAPAKAAAKAPAKSAEKPAVTPAVTKAKVAAKANAAPVKAKPVAQAPAPKPVVAPVEAAAPAKSGRPSSRLAQLTVPSMAQSVASTAAKASYTLTMTPPVTAPVIPAAIKKDPKLANNWKSKPVAELTDAELLAMPDNEYMNEVQLAAFRLKLSALKRDILSSATETTEHLREDTSVVPDPADRATIEEEHALELRTRDRERKLLKKIEQSIARIDAGDYGYCDETGEPIGVGRLLARPTATLSLEAQQRRELKQKMFGD